MLGCIALLLASSSFSFDEATDHLRKADVVRAVEALERGVALSLEDREAAMLLVALYTELADAANAQRVREPYEEGLVVEERLATLARSSVEAARQAKRPLQRSTTHVAQWNALVKIGEENMNAPYLIADGFTMKVECARAGADPGCDPLTQDECCMQTSSGVQSTCVPLEGKCEPPKRNARDRCFTTFRPEYCSLDVQAGVVLQSLRCAPASDDAAVIARVRNSPAFETLKKSYGQMWPKTLPLKAPKAKVLGRVDADGDGKEDVVVEVEIKGSRQDPAALEYSMSPDPSPCTRIFVVSGKGSAARVSLAGNELCARNSMQRFRGIATSKSANTPLLFMETTVNGAAGFEALTWDGTGYTRVVTGCFANG